MKRSLKKFAGFGGRAIAESVCFLFFFKACFDKHGPNTAYPKIDPTSEGRVWLHLGDSCIYMYVCVLQI